MKMKHNTIYVQEEIMVLLRLTGRIFILSQQEDPLL
jgi:hypothetical protein